MTELGSSPLVSQCTYSGYSGAYVLVLWTFMLLSFACNVYCFELWRYLGYWDIEVEKREISLCVAGSWFDFTARKEGKSLVGELNYYRDDFELRLLWKRLDNRYGFISKTDIGIQCGDGTTVHPTTASTSSNLIYGPVAPPLQMAVEHKVQRTADGYTVCYFARSVTPLPHIPAKDDPKFKVTMYPSKDGELKYLRGQVHVPMDGDTFVHHVNGTRQMWIFAHNQWMPAQLDRAHPDPSVTGRQLYIGDGDDHARWLMGSTVAEYKSKARKKHSAQAQI